MKKQLVLGIFIGLVFLTAFSFRTATQQPKVIVSGNTIVEGGNEENLFMVGKTTDFKVWHQEGGAEVTIKFEYLDEKLETTLKPGNEIRLLATKGFVSAKASAGSEVAALQWTLYDR